MIRADNPIRYLVSYKVRQAYRSLQNILGSNRFSLFCDRNIFCYSVVKSASPLFRSLAGVSQELFQNKGHNLRLVVDALQGIVIRPGEMFSFWRLVGPPIAERGFRPGLMIQGGRATAGIGGGLCQMSNLLHWMALHSDLEVVERHRHSFDLFPDQERSIPFGTGATILYNYKDLRFYNPTRLTFQFSLSIDKGQLKGELLCSDDLSYCYQVVEKESAFIREKQDWWRRNQIWRSKIGINGDLLEEKKLFENHCLCRYQPQEASV